MKILACCGCLLLSFALFNYPTTARADDATPPTTAPAATAVNTKCPVSGDAIDPTVPTVQYQGLNIGFCCKDCRAKFVANPDQYIAKVKADAAAH
jgi:YHS domain-containing protein